MMELILTGLFSWLLYTPSAPAQIEYRWPDGIVDEAEDKCGHDGYEMLVTPIKTLDGGDQYYACKVIVPRGQPSAR